MARAHTGRRFIDAAERFRARREQADAARAAQASIPAVPDEEAAPTSGPRLLGQRPDGTVELAAWRAQWRPIFKADFTMDLDGTSEDEGSLHVFHDPRSSSLELMVRGTDASVRHVLSPVQAMRLLVALNAAYGFDPKGPDGRPLSDHDDDDPGMGPMTA